MKVKITTVFRNRLNEQIEYIAKDKPAAARNFKTQILDRIKEIPKMPYAYRQSIFFDRTDIRDMIFKGYVIVFKNNEGKQIIGVFGFSKWQEKLFPKKPHIPISKKTSASYGRKFMRL